MTEYIKKISCGICAAILLLLIIRGIFLPELYIDKFPFCIYNVLTDSMEPKIKPDSLILVKTYREGMTIKKGDIITFRAKRFGEDVIITHRFSHTEINGDGQIIYRTHPEQSEVLDPYETTQDDLLGIYIIHFPYIGKVPLFLKSSFGFLWLCEMLLILLVRQKILVRWETARPDEKCSL